MSCGRMFLVRTRESSYRVIGVSAIDGVIGYLGICTYPVHHVVARPNVEYVDVDGRYQHIRYTGSKRESQNKHRN